MKLYEIDEEVRRIIAEGTDPETGEIGEDALRELESLDMERKAKLEAIACAVKNLRSDADEIHAEEKALAERRFRKNRRADSLSRFLEGQLNGEKLETPRVAVSFRRASAVEVYNPTLALNFLDNGGYWNCIRAKDPEIDKAACKRLIGTGVVIPGVEIVERQSMSIR